MLTIVLGPLLYHWSKEEETGKSDPRYDQSIEVIRTLIYSIFVSLLKYLLIQLSWEELKHVIESFGFIFEREEWREVSYARDHRAMMWTSYRTVFFTVRKPLL
jgi:hypothetical protein